MVQTVAQVLINNSRVKDCLFFKIHCFDGCKIHSINVEFSEAESDKSPRVS